MSQYQVQLLHESGAKIDATDKDGCTSLHLASNEGHVDVVQLLVERKCAVDQKQSDGATPLFLASQEGHHQVAQVSMWSRGLIDSLFPRFGCFVDWFLPDHAMLEAFATNVIR